MRWAGNHAEQHRGREGDERQIPAIIGILVHVADGIGVDDGADTGDQHHHDRAQAVDIETHGEGQHRERSGVVETNGNGPLCRHKPQGHDGAKERRADRIGRDLGALMPRALVAHQHNERREEREQRN